MLITRKSNYSRKENSREIPITEQEYNEFQKTGHIPERLSWEDKEFLKNGYTPEELEDLESRTI